MNKDIKKEMKQQEKLKEKYKKEYISKFSKLSSLDLISNMGVIQDEYKEEFNNYQDISQKLNDLRRGLIPNLGLKDYEKLQKDIKELENSSAVILKVLQDLEIRQQACGEIIDKRVGFKVDYSNIFNIIKLIFKLQEDKK
jgi:hypothetical protein